SGSKFINEDKPQKDAYQAAVQHAKDLINQTGNPTLDKSQVEQLTQAVTTAKDNLHGDQKLARDQQQAVTTVNALPNLNHAQQQALTDAINAAPTRTEVAQHVQTATELDHAMETLKNKVDQVNTDKAQPNYTEASTDKKEAVDQALQAAESITDPTNGSNANKDAVEQALTKLQEKVNELNGNERVAEAKTQAKQTIDQLTHLNAEQIATAKQNIDQATKLQPIAELVDQATQLNQSMDQLQQAVNEHANVEQTVDYTQADSDKQNAYKQAIAEAENVLKQNSNKQQVDQALQNILNVKQALNGDERVALAKTNGKHDIDQLNALNNAQQDGFKGRIDQSNDLNQIQQIVDEAKALNRAMDQLSQEITGNEGRTKGSTNYVNSDTQVKQVYDEAVDKAKQALDKSTGQNLTAEQVIKLNDAVTAAKQALNGEERLNNRKSEALQRLDQLTHLNNAQRQLATQQINNAETLNKASRAINRATKLDNAMGAVQQYIDEQHLGVISSTNYINADDNLKANYDNAIANAAHELDKVQGNAIAKAEAEQLKQNIIDAQNALNGDQNLANAKDKANAFVNSLNGLNKQQQDLAHNAINNADTVSDVTDIVNNQIDLNNAMETLKHLVDNEIPNAEQTVNYQNADDNAKTNFDDAKRLANTLLNSDNTNVNDINGAIQSVNDAIQNLNGDQRLQDAKDKAIQSINQALANKLKEIEASNATDQDKLIAKNKAEELANSIINKINKATSNQDVSQVQTAGNQAIEQVHANEIPKAKIDANKDADKQVQALIDEIDRNPNLTVKEKQALKDRINQILQQGHNDINNAMTKEEIEQAKSNAIKSIEDAIQHMIDEIKARTDLTDKEKQEAIAKLNQLKEQAIQLIQRAQSIDEITEQLEQFKAQMKAANPTAKELAKRKQEAISKIKDFSNEKMNSIRNSEIGSADEKQAAMNRINEIVLETIRDINNAHTLQQVEAALNNGIARISAVQIVTSDRAKQSSSTGNESNSHLTIGYGTANHPFNSSTIGHKKKLDEDDDIDPLHMRHFSNNFGNVIKNAIGVVGISGLLASFWFFIAKRRRKEDEEEELEIRDNNKDSIKETLDDTKHLPLLFAKRRRKEDEEDVTVEEKDSLNNGESLDKVKHTPFFLPKRRRKEDEEDVEVTNENTDEKVLKDNEHSPLLIAKRRKDKDKNVETTTSIESKDEDVPLLLAKKKNQKDNQSKGEKSASKKPSKKVAAKKKKKKSKKNKK
ncbi:TPA: GA module-containing protein, partial [Staphylococcus aureus]|nr:GA module-containing protein [Staphylococcus aureus]